MDLPAASIVVDFDVAVPMRDGVRLRANVYRPRDGQWPVLLTRLPYGKDLPGGGGVIDPVQSARRGYAVIVQDTRGRFASEGDFTPMEDEALDGFDTIAWAAAQPFSDGQVGMYGGSYFGFTQWSAAIEQPPALKAMVPMITWSDPLNGLSFRGGAFELGTLGNWCLMMGLDSFVRQYRDDPRALGAAIVGVAQRMDRLGTEGYASLPLKDFAPLRGQPVAPLFLDGIARPFDPARTDVVTIKGKHERVNVPTFNVGGWYDIFLSDTIANYQAMRQLGRPTKLLIGPWTHTTRGNPVGEVNFGFGSTQAFINLRMDFGRLQLRWFDHWLKGIDTGMLNEAPISLFVMGSNVWRDENEWPLARAKDTPHYMRGDGGLSTDRADREEPDGYVYDPANPVPTRGGATLMTPEFPAGPMDQREIEARPDVLSFTSDALGQDTEVTGPVRAILWACSSAPNTDFVVRLVDVFPDGRALNLTDGIVRTTFEPNQPQELEVDLWATSNVFKAGHRIRVDVTSSSFPRWDRNPNTGHAFGEDDEVATARQTILHDAEHPSHVVLPLV